MKSDEEQGCNVNKHFQNTCDWASLRYYQTELWDRKYHCIPSHSKINKEVPYNSVWNSRISQIPSAFRFHTYKQPESIGYSKTFNSLTYIYIYIYIYIY
ncbi:hypothetical protein DsansV1_C02g0023051 [Dioscorea sansibarensis]